MAGTVTETYIKYDVSRGKPDKVVASFACVGDSANGTLPATDFSAVLAALVKGMYLYLIITKPATPAPTDNYDITLIGKTTGIDLLGGAGADRDTANAEQAMPVISATPQKRLMLENATITIAGQSVNSAAFTVSLVFVRN
jgi:hypothetical protein